jgi:cytochrome c551/c552
VSLRIIGLAALLLAGLTAAAAEQGSADARARAIADYPTGDSCLFCHRNDIGSTWLDNSHAWTIRPAGEPPAVRPIPAEATHVIGSEHFRPLKQSGYGKFALLNLAGGAWQENVFEKQCVGCHATAVNPQTGEFSSIGLDCYSCHGNVPEDHATHKGTALLSRTRPSADKEVISICGSCHLRGGESQTSGRPYPYAFVAGDDLFQDFKVDLQRDLKAKIDSSDSHVYLKTRAVMLGGSNKSCVDCHRVHGPPEPRKGGAKQFSEVCHY